MNPLVDIAWIPSLWIPWTGNAHNSQSITEVGPASRQRVHFDKPPPEADSGEVDLIADLDKALEAWIHSYSENVIYAFVTQWFCLFAWNVNGASGISFKKIGHWCCKM